MVARGEEADSGGSFVEGDSIPNGKFYKNSLGQIEMGHVSIKGEIALRRIL